MEQESLHDSCTKHQKRNRLQLRRRAIISLDQKKAICRYHNQHPIAKHVEINEALGLDLERSTIVKILQEKQKWLEMDSRGLAGKKAVHRGSRFPKVNRAIALWLEMCHSDYLRHHFMWGQGPKPSAQTTRGVNRTGASSDGPGDGVDESQFPEAREIQAQARRFALMFPDEIMFKASAGWLKSFLQNLSLTQFPAIASTLEATLQDHPPFYRLVRDIFGTRTMTMSAEETMLYRRDESETARLIYYRVMSSHETVERNEDGEDEVQEEYDTDGRESGNVARSDSQDNRVKIMQSIDIDLGKQTMASFSASSMDMQSMSRPMMTLNNSNYYSSVHSVDYSSSCSSHNHNSNNNSSAHNSSTGNNSTGNNANVGNNYTYTDSNPMNNTGIMTSNSVSNADNNNNNNNNSNNNNNNNINSNNNDNNSNMQGHPTTLLVPSRERVFEAMETLRLWIRYDSGAASIAGTEEGLLYQSLSQALRRLAQGEQQEQGKQRLQQ
ncbi:hypothetical protein BGZ94_007651 [Podila epigama]|nr:hypothetical protein BGZ94_007651 [Podila epigama]